MAPNQDVSSLEEVTVVFSASESARIIRKDMLEGASSDASQAGGGQPESGQAEDGADAGTDAQGGEGA